MINIISGENLKRKIDQGDLFILIDARSSGSYEKEHITGARSLPVKEIDEGIKTRFNVDEEIVAYCGNLR